MHVVKEKSSAAAAVTATAAPQAGGWKEGRKEGSIILTNLPTKTPTISISEKKRKKKLRSNHPTSERR